jgi:hypothetical protein
MHTHDSGRVHFTPLQNLTQTLPLLMADATWQVVPEAGRGGGGGTTHTTRIYSKPTPTFDKHILKWDQKVKHSLFMRTRTMRKIHHPHSPRQSSMLVSAGAVGLVLRCCWHVCAVGVLQPSGVQ